MSERAKAREAAAEAAEAAAKDDLRQREINRWADVEPLPGETRISPDTIEVEHAGHLSHWCAPQGMHACSCGRGCWVVCFVPSAEPPPPCGICRARKIGAFAEAYGITQDQP
jgi:hypothetical protein